MEKKTVIWNGRRKARQVRELCDKIELGARSATLPTRNSTATGSIKGENS
ncbi:hypothetical protein FOXYSP1_19558 [Fusarium oxysporum f. sp. phaseoli]